MKAELRFFEIPSNDFDRAVEFYKSVFDFEVVFSSCDNEKMAMLDAEPVAGAIFHAPGYKPSRDGVLISFEVEDINAVLEKAEKSGGKIEMQKTLILADNMGYCAYFLDCEGNKIGLHSM